MDMSQILVQLTESSIELKISNIINNGILNNNRIMKSYN